MTQSAIGLDLASSLDRLESAARKIQLPFSLGVIFVLCTLPCYWVLLQLPFGYWDYWAYLNWHLNRPPSELSDIPLLLDAAYSKILFLFRPTRDLFFGLLAIVFGAQFWMYYLAKWCIRLLGVYVFALALKRWTGNREMAWGAGAVLLIHPAAFEPMLFSSDGLLATGITLTTYFALSEGVSSGSKGFRILAGIAGCLLYMLTLGTKEVGIVWGLWLIALLAYLIWTGTRRSIRTVTLFLSAIPVATFWAERVWESKTARIGETPALGRIIPVFLEELEYLTPFNKELALLMIIGSAAGAAWLALWPPGNSSRIRQGAWFALASIASGLALLLATCVTGQGAVHYVIPSAYMVIFGAGLVAAWTVQRYRALAAGCIVLLAGLCSTGNIIRRLSPTTRCSTNSEMPLLTWISAGRRASLLPMTRRHCRRKRLLTCGYISKNTARYTTARNRAP